MDSAATDVCEWCKKPMLPAGAAVTGQRGTPVIAPEAPPDQSDAVEASAETAAAASQPAVAAAEPDGLVELGAPPERPGQTQAIAQGDVLVPLGSAPGKSGLSGPSHGLGGDATKTSVDVANYLGPDQSLFKPMSKVEHSATSKGLDPLSHRGGRRQEKQVSDISDNVRLMRSTITGLLVCFPLAILQFVVTKKVPVRIFTVVPLFGGRDTFVAAIVYGVVTGVVLGFGLGALLTQIKKGPVLGLLFGLLLGTFGLATEPVYWGILAACVTGFVAGRHATYGYRKVLQV
jgi:hypothetical protein